MASDNPKGAIEAALTSSWRTATRTPIVVVPATLAALAALAEHGTIYNRIACGE